LNYYQSVQVEQLVFKPAPRFYDPIQTDEVMYCLFLSGASLIGRNTAIIIDMQNKFPYQERRIRSVKKAIKTDVKIKQDSSFDFFWKQILIPNLQNRFGVLPVHSLDEISSLAEKNQNCIKQYNAYLDGVLMAGVTVFETQLVAHAQYISASDEGRKNGSLDLLFYSLIEDIYKEKKYFDFGICNEQNGYYLNQGLLDWKEGFGARTICHDIYAVNTANISKLNLILE